jgi:glycosyltransferase involved in cell wall biosynthesis
VIFVKKLNEKLAREVGLGSLGPDDWTRLREAFDDDFYLSHNPELNGREADLFAHYMSTGWRECRDPSPSFQTLAYLLKHRDQLRSGANPFVYWVLAKTGITEERRVSHEPASPADKGAADGPLSVAKSDAPARIDRLTVPPPSAIPAGCENLSRAEVDRIREAFDAVYYVHRYQDVGSSGVDPFQHYMSIGWREMRDPNPTFSTHFYLSSYPDIAEAGGNPFVHWILNGEREKRSAISFRQRLDLKAYAPKVSAIVPNFNHGQYLAERIDSILDQTYPNISITILDDCSTDNSREVIQSYVDRFPGRIRAIFNENNSGGVFRQWRKGINETEGELIWMCESDDFCEPDFIEKLVPHFRDESVQIAFGKIQITNTDGEPNDFLDNYRESSERGIWEEPLVRPAAAWFANAFGVRNVIANVGGCIWRRSPIAESIWEEACTYKVVGDWFLYNYIARGGQIAWEPGAVAYFRHHGTNTSSTAQTGPKFYTELERLMLTLRKSWDVPAETVRKFYDWISEQYDWFNVEREHGSLDRHCSLTKLLGAQREREHILIAMQGFTPGGGESFPINLANALLENGWTVSVIIFNSNETNVHMRRALNAAVSVYDASWVADYGADRFLADAGVSLIHSHIISAESHFFRTWRIKRHVPYLVTLHGSYEASELPLEALETMASPVDHFVYTADKNLEPLKGLGIASSRFSKLANAMPVDPEPFPKTRAEMGILDDAIVFTLVARGIKRKGWRAAIEAFIKLRDRHPGRPMHLCLVGQGEEPDRHEKKHGQDPDISFLGYQSHMSGLYRISDVAIVPTRFAGESYPLCIIQALQVGTPVIGTDVGEIRSMLQRDGITGGLVIEAVRDTDKLIETVADAMEKMLDAKLRKRLAKGAQELGHDYDMSSLVQTYGEIYARLIGRGFAQSGESAQAPARSQSRLMSA